MLKQMKDEATKSEWTLFDDSQVVHKGSWLNVVKDHLEIGSYPKVIFYERIDK